MKNVTARVDGTSDFLDLTLVDGVLQIELSENGGIGLCGKIKHSDFIKLLSLLED